MSKQQINNNARNDGELTHFIGPQLYMYVIFAITLL